MTMFMRNNLAQQVIAEVQSHFGDVIYRTIIPRSVRLSEAPSHGKPIIEYEPNGLGATAYRAFAEEFLSRHPELKLATPAG
jgi:chromosome partitioning protein